MKKTIRHNVFETNSSSIHTLTVSNKICKINKEEFPIENECLFLDGMDVCCSYCIDSQREKAEYLCSYVVELLRITDKLKVNEWYDIEEGQQVTEEDHPWLKNILLAIQMENPSIKHLVVQNLHEVLWDHQTSPCESEPIISLDDVNAIHDFIFSEDRVRCGRD